MNEQLLGVLFCFISGTQKHMGFNNCLLPLGVHERMAKSNPMWRFEMLAWGIVTGQKAMRNFYNFLVSS